MKQEYVGALVFGALLLGGCSGRLEQGAALVNKVGAERLVAETGRLRALAAADSSILLPPSSWPAAIRDLTPEAVIVARDGVFVRRWRRVVEEEGVFVAFSGAVIDTQIGHDPSFTPIATQVYWYRVKG